ncbi:MAG: hypothetical protein RIB46_12225 [Pseudomonadales bacterium]
MSARAITRTSLLLTCCTIGSLQATPRFGPGPSPVAGQWQVDGAEVCAVAEETCRYLERAFEWVHWSPDHATAARLAEGKPLLQRLPADQILLTKYYVRVASGSPTQRASHPHALHGLPFDEAALGLEAADARRDAITRDRFGKQAVLQGALEQRGLAPALIWLNRADLEGALLQGTAVVDDDGRRISRQPLPARGCAGTLTCRAAAPAEPTSS